MLPLLFFALSFAAGGLSGSLAQLLSSAILFLVLGLNEELLYRGVIQHATNTLGALRSVVWVALLFGLQHAGTGIFFGHSLYETGTMMTSSTASGTAYAEVMVRIGTIWPQRSCMVWRISATPAVPEMPLGGGTYRRRSSSFSMRRGCSAGSTLPNFLEPPEAELRRIHLLRS